MNLNATIIGQSISFVFFVWFCMKYIWPQLITAIESRQKEITNSFLEIEKSKKKLFQEKKKIEKELELAKKKANEIIMSAIKDKNLILEEAQYEAKKNSKKIINLARIVIQNETLQAKEELIKKLGALSISISEKILKRTIHTDEHLDLINDAISNF